MRLKRFSWVSDGTLRSLWRGRSPSPAGLLRWQRSGWAAVRAFRRGDNTGSLRRWVRWAAVTVVAVEVIAVAAFLLTHLAYCDRRIDRSPQPGDREHRFVSSCGGAGGHAMARERVVEGQENTLNAIRLVCRTVRFPLRLTRRERLRSATGTSNLHDCSPRHSDTLRTIVNDWCAEGGKVIAYIQCNADTGLPYAIQVGLIPDNEALRE